MRTVTSRSRSCAARATPGSSPWSRAAGTSSARLSTRRRSPTSSTPRSKVSSDASPASGSPSCATAVSSTCTSGVFSASIATCGSSPATPRSAGLRPHGTATARSSPSTKRPTSSRQELVDEAAALRTHLLERLLDDLFQLGRVDARSELRQLVLDEDQAERILERLHLGVRRQLTLLHDVLDAVHHGFVVALGFEYLREVSSVLALEVSAPPEVPAATFGVAVTRNRPPSDVVAAGRQQERFAGIRAQPAHPLRRQLGVPKFLVVRVIGIGRVDRRGGAVETRLVHAIERTRYPVLAGEGELAAGAHEAVHGVGCEGRCEVEALDEVAAELLQARQFVGAFYAFRDSRQAEGV